jgi:hypothetical protein
MPRRRSETHAACSRWCSSCTSSSPTRWSRRAPARAPRNSHGLWMHRRVRRCWRHRRLIGAAGRDGDRGRLGHLGRAVCDRESCGRRDRCDRARPACRAGPSVTESASRLARSRLFSAGAHGADAVHSPARRPRRTHQRDHQRLARARRLVRPLAQRRRRGRLSGAGSRQRGAHADPSRIRRAAARAARGGRKPRRPHPLGAGPRPAGRRCLPAHPTRRRPTPNRRIRLLGRRRVAARSHARSRAFGAVVSEGAGSRIGDEDQSGVSALLGAPTRA